MKAMTMLQAGLLALSLMASGASAWAATPEPAATAPADATWIDAWGTSYLSTTVMGSVQASPALNNQTLRQFMTPKISGTAARIRLDNRFSKNPLTIGAAHIALR